MVTVNVLPALAVLGNGLVIGQNKAPTVTNFTDFANWTLAANASQLLTSPNDLASILKGALALTTVAWASSLVTATAAAAHGKGGAKKSSGRK